MCLKLSRMIYKSQKLTKTFSIKYDTLDIKGLSF